MIGVKLEFWKNQPLLHTVVQMIAFALLFVSLVFCLASNFVFAKEFNRVRNDAAGKKNESVGGRLCFLDLKESGNFETKESNSYCDYEFVTFGHSFVAITLGTLFLLLAITMFLRFSTRLDAVVFLIVAVVSFLFSFITSIVLSNGFAKTCQALFSWSLLSCSDFSKSAYCAMLRLTIFSWIETISVGAVVVIAIVYVVLRIRRRVYESLATQ